LTKKSDIFFDVEPPDPKEKQHVGHSGPGKKNAGHSFAMPANQPPMPAGFAFSLPGGFVFRLFQDWQTAEYGQNFPGAGANRGARVPPYKPALHPVPTCDKFFLMTVWK